VGVQAPIKIIYFKKDRMAFGLERPKVMLFVRVVGVAKVVKDGDGLDDTSSGFFPRRVSSPRRRSPSSAVADR
jgi:hypothetical protein